MKMKKLAQLLVNQLGLSTENALALIKDYEDVSIKKGAFLVKKGEIPRHYYFVESGVFRYYNINSMGKEYTIQFAPEYWFVGDYVSKINRTPTPFFVQALENSTAIRLEEDFITAVFNQHPNVPGVTKFFFHNHIAHLENRVNQLLSYSAEERYLNFLETFPGLSAKVSQVMIATYLGITPESLSRIRREMAGKREDQQIS